MNTEKWRSELKNTSDIQSELRRLENVNRDLLRVIDELRKANPPKDSYALSVTKAEAYATAYCKAKDIPGAVAVWRGARAGYLTALGYSGGVKGA